MCRCLQTGDAVLAAAHLAMGAKHRMHLTQIPVAAGLRPLVSTNGPKTLGASQYGVKPGRVFRNA